MTSMRHELGELSQLHWKLVESIGGHVDALQVLRLHHLVWYLANLVVLEVDGGKRLHPEQLRVDRLEAVTGEVHLSQVAQGCDNVVNLGQKVSAHFENLHARQFREHRRYRLELVEVQFEYLERLELRDFVGQVRESVASEVELLERRTRLLYFRDERGCNFRDIEVAEVEFVGLACVCEPFG